MTNLSVLSKKINLTLLASLSAIATWFAITSTSSCTFIWFYQPKMPKALIKED